MQSQQKIYNSLIGIRFFFFLFVFYFHLFGMLDIRETLCGGLFQNAGKFAVNGFFVLSGYLHALQNKQERRYQIVCKTRIKSFLQKNYFWHIAFIIIGLPFSIWAIKVGNETSVGLLKKLILCLSLTQTIIPKTPYLLAINSVSWYLSTSFLMIPLAIFVEQLIEARTSKWRKKHLCISIILVYFFQILLAGVIDIFPIGSILLYYSLFIRIFDYTIGYLFGKLYEKRNNNSTFFAGLWSILSLTLLILVLIASSKVPNFLNQGIIFTPVSCGLIYGSCVDKTWISKLFSTRILVILGKLARYLFISHYVICEYMLRIFEIVHVDNRIYKIIICISASLICAKVMQSLTQYRIRKKIKQYGGV